jgi:hypothetical protein
MKEALVGASSMPSTNTRMMTEGHKNQLLPQLLFLMLDLCASVAAVTPLQTNITGTTLFHATAQVLIGKHPLPSQTMNGISVCMTGIEPSAVCWYSTS